MWRTVVVMMKPMLAATCKKLSDISYPCYVTPKIDGIRCLIVNGYPVSRSLKSIRNQHIQRQLRSLPEGLDGELTLRDKMTEFNEVSSAVMREDGKPNFVYLIFDQVGPGGYLERVDRLKELDLPDYCEILEPAEILNEQELLWFEEQSLEFGFEGVMVRSAHGVYKYGRSTVREGGLLKLKRFADGEAEILGFLEQMHNENEATVNALGHTERSSHKENLSGKGTLGAIRARDLETGIEFKIGTGFNDELRQEIWNNLDKCAEKIIKYKYQPTGVKEAPRFPVFLGFRDREDM